jgi:hypothetical protein
MGRVVGEGGFCQVCGTGAVGAQDTAHCTCSGTAMHCIMIAGI